MSKPSPEELIKKIGKSEYHILNSFEIDSDGWTKDDIQKSNFLNNGFKIEYGAKNKVFYDDKKTYDEYYINSYGLRSDEFINDHEGMHILFAGCSNTVGVGLPLENIWPYKVYSEIKKTNKVSGYFNVSLSGGRITHIIWQIFKYINNYGNPDLIFINFPQVAREHQIINKRDKESQIFYLYMMLEQYCITNNIKLFSFSWNTDPVFDIRSTNDILGNIIKNKTNDLTNFNFKSFYTLDFNFIRLEMEKYVLENSKDKNLFIAKDKCHPGTAEQYAWYKFIYDKYLQSL